MCWPGTGTSTFMTRCPSRSSCCFTAYATRRTPSRSSVRSRTTICSSLNVEGAPSMASVDGVAKAYTTCSIQPGARPTSRASAPTATVTAGLSPIWSVTESPTATPENSTDECSIATVPARGGHSPSWAEILPMLAVLKSSSANRTSDRGVGSERVCATPVMVRRACTAAMVGNARIVATVAALTESTRSVAEAGLLA